MNEAGTLQFVVGSSFRNGSNLGERDFDVSMAVISILHPRNGACALQPVAQPAAVNPTIQRLPPFIS